MNSTETKTCSNAKLQALRAREYGMAGACSRDIPRDDSTRNACALSTVVQRILPYCQHKAFAIGFLSIHLCYKAHWAQHSNSQV